MSFRPLSGLKSPWSSDSDPEPGRVVGSLIAWDPHAVLALEPAARTSPELQRDIHLIFFSLGSFGVQCQFLADGCLPTVLLRGKLQPAVATLFPPSALAFASFSGSQT